MWLALLVACGAGSPLPPGWFGSDAPAASAPAVDADVGAYVVDGPVAVAKVIRSPASVPARFTVSLPHHAADWAAWSADPNRPPDAWIRAGVCHDRDGWRDAWLAAVQDAANDGASADDLADWTALAASCSRPDRCAWVRNHVGTAVPGRGTPEEALRGVFLDLLVDCGTAADASLVEDSSVPDWAAIGWYRQQWGYVGWSPRLATALDASVARRDPVRTRVIAAIVASLDPARSAPTLLFEHERAVDLDTRDAIAISLARSADPQAMALVEDICARRSSEVDGASASPRFPACAWRLRAGWAPAPDPINGIDAWVRAPNADPWTWVHDHPEQNAAVVDALVSCVLAEAWNGANAPDGTEGWKGRACLERLARLDRGRAVVVAPNASAIPDPEAKALAASLIRFPTIDALERHLREIGLVPGSATPPDRPYVDAEDVLEHQGRLYRLYTDDPHGFPLDHAVLLWNLAALSGALLDDVRFDAPAPIAEDATAYPMLAWDGSLAWRFHAENRGSSFDTRAAIGLLNAILSEKVSDLRYARLASGDIVVAPGAALRLAGKEGLLDLQDGGVPTPEDDD